MTYYFTVNSYYEAERAMKYNEPIMLIGIDSVPEGGYETKSYIPCFASKIKAEGIEGIQIQPTRTNVSHSVTFVNDGRIEIT